MRLFVIDIPGKHRFDLLQQTLEYLNDGRTMRSLARAINEHERHAHFLVQNARILGLVVRDETRWILSESGKEFVNATTETKGLILARAMLDSRIVSALIMHAGSLEAASRMTVEEISDFLVETTFVSEGNRDPIQGVTANRRASSVKYWIQWLRTNLPRIESEHKGASAISKQKTLGFN